MPILTPFRAGKAASVLASLPVAAPSAAAGEKADRAVVHRIKAEAFDNAQVMDHPFRLAEVIGPHVTGSPPYRAAASSRGAISSSAMRALRPC